MKFGRLILTIFLALSFIVSGINHFLSPDFYLKLMPLWMPAHAPLVMISGVTELVAGVLVLVPRTTRWGAWLIIAHLVVFLVVHIDMVANAERFPDIPLAALWARILIQFVAIGLAFVLTRKPRARE